jgi:hypothetical protein
MSTAIRLDRLDKNYLINGGLDFFQRGGASGAVNLSTTPTYVAADRFKMSYTGTVTGTPNTQRVTSTLNPSKSKYAVQLTGQRNASTLTFTMEQRIEGIEAREPAYVGSASFSLWVFTPISGCSVRLTLNAPTVEDNYTSVTQLSQQTSATTITASTWTKITFNNLTIPSTASNGLAVVVDLQIPSGTDGSAQNHLMTQLMLNAGSSASDFARSGRNFTQEYSFCQRYFEKSYDVDTSPGTATTAGVHFFDVTANSINNADIAVWYAVPKRVAGTITAYDAAGNVNKITNSTGNNQSTFTFTTPGTRRLVLSVQAATSFAEFHWTADAEL